MNEQSLLKRIFAESHSLGPEIAIGPGDDMALLRPSAWAFDPSDASASGGVLLGDCASFDSVSRNQTGHNIANLPFSFAATIN